MGARVVEPEPLAAPRLHAHGHVLAFPERALGDMDAMDDELGAAVVGVLDPPLTPATRDGSGIAHLAARLRIGGRAVEDHLDCLALSRLRPALALGDHRQ